jgi:hypothetical protein
MRLGIYQDLVEHHGTAVRSSRFVLLNGIVGFLESDKRRIVKTSCRRSNLFNGESKLVNPTVWRATLT